MRSRSNCILFLILVYTSLTNKICTAENRVIFTEEDVKDIDQLLATQLRLESSKEFLKKLSEVGAGVNRKAALDNIKTELANMDNGFPLDWIEIFYSHFAPETEISSVDELRRKVIDAVQETRAIFQFFNDTHTISGKAQDTLIQALYTHYESERELLAQVEPSYPYSFKQKDLYHRFYEYIIQTAVNEYVHMLVPRFSFTKQEENRISELFTAKAKYISIDENEMKQLRLSSEEMAPLFNVAQNIYDISKRERAIRWIEKMRPVIEPHLKIFPIDLQDLVRDFENMMKEIPDKGDYMIYKFNKEERAIMTKYLFEHFHMLFTGLKKIEPTFNYIQSDKRLLEKLSKFIIDFSQDYYSNIFLNHFVKDNYFDFLFTKSEIHDFKMLMMRLPNAKLENRGNKTPAYYIQVISKETSDEIRNWFDKFTTLLLPIFDEIIHGPNLQRRIKDSVYGATNTEELMNTTYTFSKRTQDIMAESLYLYLDQVFMSIKSSMPVFHYTESEREVIKRICNTIMEFAVHEYNQLKLPRFAGYYASSDLVLISKLFNARAELIKSGHNGILQGIPDVGEDAKQEVKSVRQGRALDWVEKVINPFEPNSLMFRSIDDILDDLKNRVKILVGSENINEFVKYKFNDVEASAMKKYLFELYKSTFTTVVKTKQTLNYEEDSLGRLAEYLIDTSQIYYDIILNNLIDRYVLSTEDVNKFLELLSREKEYKTPDNIEKIKELIRTDEKYDKLSSVIDSGVAFEEFGAYSEQLSRQSDAFISMLFGYLYSFEDLNLKSVSGVEDIVKTTSKVISAISDVFISKEAEDAMTENIYTYYDGVLQMLNAADPSFLYTVAEKELLQRIFKSIMQLSADVHNEILFNKHQLSTEEKIKIAEFLTESNFLTEELKDILHPQPTENLSLYEAWSELNSLIGENAVKWLEANRRIFENYSKFFKFNFDDLINSVDNTFDTANLNQDEASFIFNEKGQTILKKYLYELYDAMFIRLTKLKPTLNYKAPTEDREMVQKLTHNAMHFFQTSYALKMKQIKKQPNEISNRGNFNVYTGNRRSSVNFNDNNNKKVKIIMKPKTIPERQNPVRKMIQIIQNSPLNPLNMLNPIFRNSFDIAPKTENDDFSMRSNFNSNDNKHESDQFQAPDIAKWFNDVSKTIEQSPFLKQMISDSVDIKENDDFSMRSNFNSNDNTNESDHFQAPDIAKWFNDVSKTIEQSPFLMQMFSNPVNIKENDDFLTRSNFNANENIKESQHFQSPDIAKWFDDVSKTIEQSPFLRQMFSNPVDIKPTTDSAINDEPLTRTNLNKNKNISGLYNLKTSQTPKWIEYLFGMAERSPFNPVHILKELRFTNNNGEMKNIFDGLFDINAIMDKIMQFSRQLPLNLDTIMRKLAMPDDSFYADLYKNGAPSSTENEDENIDDVTTRAGVNLNTNSNVNTHSQTYDPIKLVQNVYKQIEDSPLNPLYLIKNLLPQTLNKPAVSNNNEIVTRSKLKSNIKPTENTRRSANTNVNLNVNDFTDPLTSVFTNILNPGSSDNKSELPSLLNNDIFSTINSLTGNILNPQPLADTKNDGTTNLQSSGSTVNPITSVMQNIFDPLSFTKGLDTITSFTKNLFPFQSVMSNLNLVPTSVTFNLSYIGDILCSLIKSFFKMLDSSGLISQNVFQTFINSPLNPLNLINSMSLPKNNNIDITARSFLGPEVNDKKIVPEDTVLLNDEILNFGKQIMESVGNNLMQSIANIANMFQHPTENNYIEKQPISENLKEVKEIKDSLSDVKIEPRFNSVHNNSDNPDVFFRSLIPSFENNYVNNLHTQSRKEPLFNMASDITENFEEMNDVDPAKDNFNDDDNTGTLFRNLFPSHRRNSGQSEKNPIDKSSDSMNNFYSGNHPKYSNNPTENFDYFGTVTPIQTATVAPMIQTTPNLYRRMGDIDDELLLKSTARPPRQVTELSPFLRKFLNMDKPSNEIEKNNEIPDLNTENNLEIPEDYVFLDSFQWHSNNKDNKKLNNNQQASGNIEINKISEMTTVETDEAKEYPKLDNLNRRSYYIGNNIPLNENIKENIDENNNQPEITTAQSINIPLEHSIVTDSLSRRSDNAHDKESLNTMIEEPSDDIENIPKLNTLEALNEPLEYPIVLESPSRRSHKEDTVILSNKPLGDIIEYDDIFAMNTKELLEMPHHKTANANFRRAHKKRSKRPSKKITKTTKNKTKHDKKPKPVNTQTFILPSSEVKTIETDDLANDEYINMETINNPHEETAIDLIKSKNKTKRIKQKTKHGKTTKPVKTQTYDIFPSYEDTTMETDDLGNDEYINMETINNPDEETAIDLIKSKNKTKRIKHKIKHGKKPKPVKTQTNNILPSSEVKTIETDLSNDDDVEINIADDETAIDLIKTINEMVHGKTSDNEGLDSGEEVKMVDEKPSNNEGLDFGERVKIPDIQILRNHLLIKIPDTENL